MVESKIGCVNLIFSDGSYFKTVLPLLASWHKKLNEKLFIDETEVQIVEIHFGKDSSEKHVDTKLVMMVDKSRIVLHSYNSKQKLMVQGQNYEKFASNCLEPFFKKKIDETLDQITKINDEIKESLSNKESSKIEKAFNCPQCEIESCSKADLKVHIKSCHTKPSLSSPPKNKVPRVLQEDLSISAIDEHEILALELEETQEEQHGCDWESCGYTSKNRTDLRKHFEDEHMEYLRKKYLQQGEQGSNEDEQLAKDGDQSLADKNPTSKETNDELVINSNECETVIEEEKSKDDIIEQEEERAIPEQHDQVETVTIENTTCILCGEDFADNGVLNEHTNNIHKKQDKKPTPSSFKCEKCPFTSKTEIGIGRHKEYFCSKCSVCLAEKMEVEIHSSLHKECISKNCDFASSGTQNLRDHVVSKHPKENFPCTKCDIVLKSEKDLMTHFNNTHRNAAKEKATKSIQTQTDEVHHSCDQCDFSHKDMTVIMKHIIDIHCLPAREYKCNECEFSAEDETYLKLHKINTHNASEFMSEKNMIQTFCNFIGRMISDSNELVTRMISENSENVCKLIKNQEKLEKSMGNVEAEIKEIKISKNKTEEQVLTTNVKDDGKSVHEPESVKTILDNQNVIQQEVFLLRNVLAAKAAPVSKEPDCASPPAPRRATSSRISTPPKESWQQIRSTPQQPQSQHRRYERDQRQKTLYVGDSVSAHVRIDALEKATRTKIVTESNIAKNAAKFPEANFTEMLPQKLQEDTFQNLMVQAGSVDISNLKTDIEPTKYSAYFQQVATVSAKNLFSACEYAAMKNPSLKKIIVLKQTPRYDPASVDPLSVRPVLSELFNRTLEQCLQSSQVRDRIFLGTHSIDCTGAIRDARYRETKSGRFDGLHLFGTSGSKAYTNSVLNILQSAGMVDPEFDHSNCSQARFQARRGVHVKNYFWQNDVDTRRSGCGRDQLNMRYEIPTQNRFSSLADNFQGNY